MKDKLEAGIFIEKTFDTGTEDAASRFHENVPRVLSTPSIVGFIQTTCVDLMAPFLDDGEMVVSIRIEVSHFSPAKVGATIKIRAEVVRISGRNIYFKVDTYDNQEKIVSGYNDMFIIDRDRFERGVKRKK